MEYHVEIRRGDEFYIAECVEKRNCFSQGRTIEEAIANVKEVIGLIEGVERPVVHVTIADQIDTRATERKLAQPLSGSRRKVQ